MRNIYTKVLWLGAMMLAVAMTATASESHSHFQISSGGLASIEGDVGGMVTGSSSSTSSLAIQVNLGEVSPANPNDRVTVVIPVIIRARRSYAVTARLQAPSFNPDPLAVQPSDVGIGIQNLQPLGSGAWAADCTASTHQISPPFDTNPATEITFEQSGRAHYPASLGHLSASRTLLSGPKLTKGSLTSHTDSNGFQFDLVLALTPQYYSPSSFAFAVMLTIEQGPSICCHRDHEDGKCDDDDDKDDKRS